MSHVILAGNKIELDLRRQICIFAVRIEHRSVLMSSQCSNVVTHIFYAFKHLCFSAYSVLTFRLFNDMLSGKSVADETEINIMTYPRYCRYRCVLKRLENCSDKWLKHALVCAIGGFSAKSSNNRIYFCRDIFDHPDLDEFELRCEHLGKQHERLSQQIIHFV